MVTPFLIFYLFFVKVITYLNFSILIKIEIYNQLVEKEVEALHTHRVKSIQWEFEWPDSGNFSMRNLCASHGGGLCTFSFCPCAHAYL